MSDYLEHHGIKNQRWYHRRFQNADGSLTPAGKERYGEWKPGQYKKTKLNVVRDDDGRKKYKIESEDGTSVGDITTTHQSDESLRVNWISVNKDHKREGYASSAMNTLIQDAKDSGYKKITVVIPTGSKDVQHIYERLGFTASKEGLTTDEIADSITSLGDVVKLEYSLEHSDFLEHYGVGHDDSPPGRGSGRYAYGSGKRPMQDIRTKEDRLAAMRMRAVEKSFNESSKKDEDYGKILQKALDEASKYDPDLFKNKQEDVMDAHLMWLFDEYKKALPKKQVFVSGSSHTQTENDPYYRKELPKAVRDELDKLVADSAGIIVGDAPGIDRQVQDYLKTLNYENVSVYGPGKKLRYLANENWTARPIDAPEFEPGSPEWLAKKDIAMEKDATEGLAVILDEGAKATRNNIKRLQNDGKDVKVYELNKASAELDHWVDKLLDEVKHEDELGEYLEHYGVGHLQGGHSGRYPWGSGERPKQSHDRKIYSRNAEKANAIFDTFTDKEKYYITANNDTKQYVSKEEYGKNSTNVYSRIEYYKDKGASFFDVWCNDPGVGEVAIGVRNDPEFRGKGYSKRAMEAGLKWFEKNKDMKWLVWGVNVDNMPSRKLAEKYGFKLAETEGEWASYIKKKQEAKHEDALGEYLEHYGVDSEDNGKEVKVYELNKASAELDHWVDKLLDEVKHEDELGEYLEHYGVGPDDNPPGRGSGRYARGSGERPFQHDPVMQNTFNRRRKKWGIFERIRQRREEAAKEHAEAAKKSEEDRQLTEAKNKAEALKKKRLEALNKARAIKKANADKAATEKAAKEKYEAEKKEAIDSGDPEKIAKYLKDLTNQEQIDAINRIGNTAKIKALADEQKRAFKAAEDARIAAEKALEEANRPRTKAEIRERKFNEAISKIQNASNKLDKLRDSGEKIIKFYNMAASVNNALNDKVKLPKIDLGPNQKKDGDKKDKQDGDKKEKDKQQNNGGSKSGDTYNTTHDSHDTYNTYNNYGWDDYTERFYRQYQDQPNSGEWKTYESQGLLLLEDFSKRKK